MNRLVIATRNAGKVKEIKLLLDELPVEVMTPYDFPGAPEVEEDAPTLAGNAVKKAVALFRHTGLPALADDTGLEVDALDGAPGVRSARYAGEACDDAANRRLLLRALEGVVARGARFRTVMALARNEADIRMFEGRCEGVIVEEERGTGGFGYDAVFQPVGENRTFAELTNTEKNAISHRGAALRRVVAHLKASIQDHQAP